MAQRHLFKYRPQPHEPLDEKAKRLHEEANLLSPGADREAMIHKARQYEIGYNRPTNAAKLTIEPTRRKPVVDRFVVAYALASLLSVALLVLALSRL